VGGPNPEALATIAQVVAQMSAAAERSARAKRHKIAKVGTRPRALTIRTTCFLCQATVLCLMSAHTGPCSGQVDDLPPCCAGEAVEPLQSGYKFEEAAAANGTCGEHLLNRLVAVLNVHKVHVQEAEAAADAEVAKTEAAVRRIQEAAAKHIAAQHEQLRQVQ
jgi:hypothetical protein